MKLIPLDFRENIFLRFIFILFGLIFASITFVNHYNFRTFGWDLGINNNAIFDYAHFRWNDSMIMQPQFTNVLADHFSLYPILISPFYWIFGTWTMLIFQFIAILFGGLGIYKYVLLTNKDKHVATIASAFFFSIWGIYSALSFDYHDNVVAAMFVPWFILFAEQKKWTTSSVFFILILISKENMALWAIFLAAGMVLYFHRKKENKAAIIMLIYSLFAGVYFVTIVKIIIPALASSGRDYLHYSYSALGKDFGEVILTVIKRPFFVLELLFTNHTNDPDAFGVKTELYVALFLAGGYSLIFFPHYLIMIIPIVAQKVFNDLHVRWGLNGQYSIEFAPILTLSVFALIQKIRNHKLRYAYLFLAICLGSTIKFFDSRVSKWYKPEQERFYSRSHWIRNFNVSKVHKELEKIPKNAKVSAQSSLVPHLAMRDYIYHYPHVEDASYIALLTIEENKYPFKDAHEYNEKIDQMLDSSEWEVFLQTEALLILSRKAIE